MIVHVSYNKKEGIVSTSKEKFYKFSFENEISEESKDIVIFVYNKQNYTIKQMMPITKFEIADNNDNRFYCPNRFYCSEATWFLFERSIPFIQVSRGPGAWVCYPVSSSYSKCQYLEGSISCSNSILRLIQRTILIPRLPKNDLIKEAEYLQRIRNYVDTLDVEKILCSYQIFKSGYLKRIVGKDDYFVTSVSKKVATNDSYINSLFPIGEETDYYDAYTPEDYSYIDEEESLRYISEAKKLYSKDKHYAFLVAEYYRKTYQLKNDLDEAYRKLQDYFCYSYLFKKYGAVFPPYDVIIESNKN